MSDNVSLIDAIRLVAKATRDDAAKVSDIVKGALRPDQIDDMRLMLSRAREGSLAATAPASTAATSATALRLRPVRPILLRRPLAIEG